MTGAEGQTPLPYEAIDHTADLAYIARGATQAELFQHAAEGLTAFLLDPKLIACRDCDLVEVTGADLEECLVNWLNELIYREEVLLRVYARFEVEFTGLSSLRAVCSGEELDRGRHTLLTDLKAATYHDLRITSDGQGGYEARIVLDI